MEAETNTNLASIESSAGVLEQALQSLAEAEAKQAEAYESVSGIEGQMHELQRKAEESLFIVVEAEAAVDAANRQLEDIDKNAEKARHDYQEALDILAEAQKLVTEAEEKLNQAEEVRAAKEQELAPVYLQLGIAKTTHSRFLAMADIEGAKLKRAMASVDEDVSISKVAVFDARLQLLSSPEALTFMPQIKEIMWEGC